MSGNKEKNSVVATERFARKGDGLTDSKAAGLLNFVASFASNELRVEENLGYGYVRLRVDEAERRQAANDIRCAEDVIVELLRNSRDAGAHQIYVATSREGDLRTTTVIDDGSGIPPALTERVFDARVTSKLTSAHKDRWGIHGRGMALFAVRANTVSARVVSSGKGLGTSLQVVSDSRHLQERADQSSWPKIGMDDDGELAIVRGPHNIVRACAEFSMDERESCEVYLGSPADIIATARAHVRMRSSATELLFLEKLTTLPLLERFRAAADAQELQEVAAGVGLEISQRTAHRILSGQIRPKRSVYARLVHTDEGQKDTQSAVDLMRDRRGLRISAADAEEFAGIMERDFGWLAKRYYLGLRERPRINTGSGRVIVTFEVVDDG